MENGDTTRAASDQAVQPAAAADYRAPWASAPDVAAGDHDPRSGHDEGTIRLTKEMVRQLGGEPVPDDRVVTAEWALWGKEGSETAYRVLRCSDGAFSRDDFREVITRYASGVKDLLPQYTACWIPDTRGREAYLGVAIHELADPDPARSGGRIRIVAGEVEYVRLFCVPYLEMAGLAVSYADLAGSVMGYQMPAGDSKPTRVVLRADSGMQPVAARSRVLAENVAALLLTTRPVCVLGAEGTTAEDRLRFIELVMSLLPYGLRFRLSASTWASSTAQDLKLRLFFANAPRDDGRTSYVTWDHPEPPPLGAEHEAVRLYLSWLRRTGPAAAPALAGVVTPMRFTREDVYRLVRELPSDRSVTETLEDLADGLRKGDEAAIGTGIERLTRHLASPQDGRSRAIEREACRKVIIRRGMLKSHPALPQESKLRLYRVLLRLAFDMPLSYSSYCEIEQAVGGPPRGTLRSVMLTHPDELWFSSFVPWLLAVKAEPTFQDQKLMAALAGNRVAPTEPIDEVARLAGTIRPEHRAVVYDFAAHYLRGAQDPWYELKERGYLAETLEVLFPADLRHQQSRLVDTLKFVYGRQLSQDQINDLFSDSRLHPTAALEQAVRSLAASPRVGRDIARQAAFARLSSAGYGDDALLLTQGTEERNRPPLRQRVRQLSSGAIRTAVIIAAIAAFVVYLVVTAANH